MNFTGLLSWFLFRNQSKRAKLTVVKAYESLCPLDPIDLLYLITYDTSKMICVPADYFRKNTVYACRIVHFQDFRYCSKVA